MSSTKLNRQTSLKASIFQSSDDEDDDTYLKKFNHYSSRRSSIFFGGEEEGLRGRRNAASIWPDLQQIHFTEDDEPPKKKKFVNHFDNITFPCFDKSTTRALFIFTKSNVIRRFCDYIIHNKLFEYFILVVIIGNCIVLAAEEYLPGGDRNAISYILEEFDPYFIIIFTTEAVLKIIAKGFLLHTGSYLRSAWNILDFVIVLSGLLSKISSLFNQPALRALRVLRPVKIVTGFESLHVVLKSIVCAMAPLLQIGFLVLFAVFIFAIIGLEFYSGTLHLSCWNPATQEFDYTEDDNQVACSNSYGDNVTSIIGAGFVCPEGYICKGEWEGPLSGLQNFDNIYLSFLTVFVVLTMAGWTDLQYRLDDALGRLFNWLYFVPIIIFGAFFMLNLVLGVLSCEFANERQRVEKRKEFLKMRRQKEVDTAVENYLDWIISAEERILQEARTSNETKLKIIEARRTSIFKRRNVVSDEEILSTEMQEKVINERKSNCFKRIWRRQKLTRIEVKRILKSQVFFWLVIVLVFINTTLIASEHYGQPKWLEDVLTYSEYVFLSIFYIEMLLKMYGLGFRGYFKSLFNRFDFIVLIASTAEIVAQMYNPENSYGFSSLRATRLLRIFKITKYWQSLRNLSLSLINSIKSIMSLLFLLSLFMVIFALLGMQFFGGKFNFEEGRPKANFDTFSSSLLTVFQILTGENWDEVLYDGMKALGGFNVWGGLASLYFLLLVVLGSYTLLNVFLAIAVDNLAKADELTNMEMAEEQRRKSLPATDLLNMDFGEVGYDNVGATVEIIDMEKESMEPKITPIISAKTNRSKPQMNRMLSINSKAIDSSPRGSIEHEILKRNSISRRNSVTVNNNDNNKNILDNNSNVKQILKKIKTFNDNEKDHNTNNSNNNDIEDESEDDGENKNTNNNNDVGDEDKNADDKENTKEKSFSDVDPNPILRYSSLFIFSSNNPIRKFAHFIVTLPYFDNFIVAVILLSCIALAIADPVTFESSLNAILDRIDLAFTAIFTIEVMLKVINLGLILHKGAYCRDLWNLLDLFIVVSAVASIAFAGTGQNLQTIRSLRVLRVLRPLKTINRVAKLKAVFDGLVVAVTKVFVIMSLYLLFQIMFAIIAVQLFMGNFFYCSDLSKNIQEECKGEYLEYNDFSIDVKPREWNVYEFNFDNLGNSLLTLFVVQTRSGWPGIMKNAMDSSTRDHGPIPEYNNAMSTFFIVYFIVFPFFFVNLFVALIVITFQEQGEKDLDELDMDKNQKNCLEFVINASPLDCYCPDTKSKIRLKIWEWVISKPFDYLMSMLILLNTVTLMMKFYKQPLWYDTMLNYSNIFFTVAFTVEFLIKLFAFGIRNYFRQGWNVFDFITVLGSIVDIIVFYAISSIKTLGFLKLFRAMRLLKLLRQSSSIRMLLWTFLQAINALPYVLLLIWLLFYIYAVIGMQLFGTIKLDPQTAINRHANFQNFINAIVLLFRCSTLDNWDTVLNACVFGMECDERSLPPDSPPSSNCGSNISILYYVSFNFITAFMMLNLFVAVIMDNFDYLTRDSSILGPHHLDDYVQKWALYDPTATGLINYNKAYDLLLELEPPVGFGRKCPQKLAYKKLIRMNMPINDEGKVKFSTTMFALVRESLGIKMAEVEHMEEMDMQLKSALVALFFLKPEQISVFMPGKEELVGKKLTIGKVYASKLLVEAWKSIKLSRNPPPVETPGEENNPRFINRLISTMSNIFHRKSSTYNESDDDYARNHGNRSRKDEDDDEDEDDSDRNHSHHNYAYSQDEADGNGRRNEKKNNQSNLIISNDDNKNRQRKSINNNKKNNNNNNNNYVDYNERENDDDEYDDDDYHQKRENYTNDKNDEINTNNNNNNNSINDNKNWISYYYYDSVGKVMKKNVSGDRSNKYRDNYNLENNNVNYMMSEKNKMNNNKNNNKKNENKPVDGSWMQAMNDIKKQNTQKNMALEADQKKEKRKKN